MIDKSQQTRHEALGLSDQDVKQMYRTMLMARRLDERMWLLNRSGKIHFLVSCQGQEAAQVGAAFALDKEKDYVLPYYRDVGVVLAFGMTAKDLMLNVYARKEDPNSGARQMPGHFGGKKYRIVTGSSPVTTQLPHAAGMALAAKMEGKDLVAFTTFGEGSSNQGDFHEGLNFAAVHKLPVIFMCENNKYAISVPLSKQLACDSVADRAVGYGMPGVSADGNDPLLVYATVKEAVERARRGEGPTLIETTCYRFTPHSSDDDDRSYRDQEEVAEAKKLDPLPRFEAYLLHTGVLDEQSVKQMEDEIMREIDEATSYAEQAPYPDPLDTLKHVYAD
jgi:2-oxoisovalerate dehydrogenase E1 component alpha subunit